MIIVLNTVSSLNENKKAISYRLYWSPFRDAKLDQTNNSTKKRAMKKW